MTGKPSKCLIVYAPEWFLRKDFWGFIVNHLEHKPGQRRIASWHDDPKSAPHENSDVFFTIDGYEIDEAGFLPADIVASLVEAAKAHSVNHGVLWIQNQADPGLPF